jgi:hypothetical protein
MLIEVKSDKLVELDLTPNQYCLAYLIHKKDEKGFKIFRDLYRKELYFKEDIYNLVSKKYLKQKVDNPHKIVFSESTIEGIFDDEIVEEVLVEVVNELDEWDIFVKAFRDIFPNGVTSGGLYVKSSTKDCSRKLEKFMQEYPEFDQEIILQATKAYVERYRMSAYKYMKTANYFIMKDKLSVLASECEIVKDNNGENQSSQPLFGGGI